MSLTPSYTPAQGEPPRRAARSRHNSTVGPATGDAVRNVKQAPSVVAPALSKPVHYTCVIRLPFTREGFEEPALVQWDAIKDRALWKLISQASNSKDLNWEEMSVRFDVSLSFLLQQAAWLYERHFEGMKAQMKKLGTGSIAATGTSPVSLAEGTAGSTIGAGGVSMQRTGSRESRGPVSAINTAVSREAASLPSAGDTGSSPGTPRVMAPPISRTPSSATVTQSRMQNTGPLKSQPVQRALRGSNGSERRPTVPPPKTNTDTYYEDAVEHEGPFASDSEEEASALARSRALRRAPFAKKAKAPIGTVASDGDAEEDDDDDDDDDGGYLPFAAPTSKTSRADPAATLRNMPKKQPPGANERASSAGKKPKPSNPPPQSTAPESSTSSASSAVPHQLSSSGTEGAELVQRPGPISPQHRAQLASLSPRMRREGSEDSPSMGSSFSDLDDASVTQSALEDALLSNMRQGNFSSMASRMSSLRDALGR